jgi:hypothetical protein
MVEPRGIGLPTSTMPSNRFRLGKSILDQQVLILGRLMGRIGRALGREIERPLKRGSLLLGNVW